MSTASAVLTHSPTMRRLLYEGLLSLGWDPTDTYRRAYQGVPLAPPLISGREEHDNAPLFWDALQELTGDCDIGLHLAEVMKPRPLDVVSYLLLASRDLREALQCFVRYQHILSGGFAAYLDEQGDSTRLVLDLNYRGFGSLRQQIECLALLLIKMLGSVTDEEFRVQCVEFRHPAPRRLSEHKRLFGLMPHFAQPHDALVFPTALLTRPSRSANPRLFELLKQQAELELRELGEDQLLNRVRYWLHSQLGQASCSLTECAEALHLNVSALQRGLAQHSSSFRALHEEVRRLQACQLLEAGQPIREVARACGFAELSPFYRAFRRWQGVTPQAYQLKAQALTAR